MFSQFDTLLIPVESQVRELDGKLLLACVAAEKGYKVIIGSRAHIHFYASRIKHAIYIAKSMRRFSDRMFKIMHDLGHRIVAWDEEALVRLPDEEYYNHRLSPITFKYIEHLFAWGESNAHTLAQYPGYLNQPIHVFGNPRIDILRPELRGYFHSEVDAITNRHKDYILINTNFGQVNHFIHTQGTKEAERDKRHDAIAKNSYMENRFTHKQKLFSHFKTLVIKLSETFPNTNFILRPHPSENIEHWRHHLKQIDNAYVTNTGNVIPWILGAKALISNGCTTAIEATILGVPTLGYYPILDLEVDDVLPKALSDVSTDIEQLFKKIDAINSNTYKISGKSAIILAQHVANADNALSSDRIIDVLYNYYNNDIATVSGFTSILKGIVHNEARTIVKRFNSARKSHRNSAEYHKHRFPEIDNQYLAQRIHRLNTLTRRFGNVKVSNISSFVFSITT